MEYPNHKMSCKIPVEKWRLPTAEEFIRDKYMVPKTTKISNDRIVEMIEFAKLHCEAQLKAILEKADTKLEKGVMDEYRVVDEDSIINAYNLNQIK
jgi:hypothetical protein